MMEGESKTVTWSATNADNETKTGSATFNKMKEVVIPTPTGIFAYFLAPSDWNQVDCWAWNDRFFGRRLHREQEIRRRISDKGQRHSVSGSFTDFRTWTAEGPQRRVVQRGHQWYGICKGAAQDHQEEGTSAFFAYGLTI